MKKISNRQIQRYFSIETIKTGLQYFAQSKVSSVLQKGNIITAYVDKPKNGKYIVVIKLGYEGDILETDCQCPERHQCSHAAAVIFYFEKFGPHKKENILPENPLESVHYDTYEKKIIIKNDYNASLNKNLDFFIEGLTRLSNKPVKKEGSQKLVLVLLDEEEYYPPDKAIELKKIRLSLGCRLIKKDGIPGKIKPYSKNMSIPFMDEKIESVYDSLSNKMNFSDMLVKYIVYITANRIPVYSMEGYQEQIDFIEMEKIELDFSLVDINAEKQSGLYVPHAYAVFDNEGKKNMLEIREYSASDDTVIIKNANAYNMILYKKFDNEKVIKFFKEFVKLINSAHEINLSGIKKIHDFVADAGLTDIFEVNYKKENITFIREKPGVILELSEQYMPNRYGGNDAKTLILKLFFKYKNIEIRYDDILENEYLMYQNSDEINLLYMDRKLFREIYVFLSGYLEKEKIESGYPYDFDGHDRFRTIELKATLINFLEKHAEYLINKGYEIRLKGERTTFTNKSGRIKLNVSSGIDWFDLQAKYSDDTGTYDIDLTKIKNRIAKIDNRYVLITKENMEMISSLMKEGMDDKGNLKFNKNRLYLINEYYDRIENNSDDELTRYKKISENLKGFERIEKIDVPAGFIGELRNYQHAGFNWLCFLDRFGLNGCLADDMGLGKTIQTLCLLLKLKDENRLGNVLLAAPVTTLANWENEIRKFAPSLSFSRHVGQNRIKEEELIKSVDITVISYHTLRNDIDFFDKLEFNYFILDESQNIKNARSQIYKAVKLIRSNHKLSLSGTPVENNTVELWAQFNFLNPGLLGNQTHFMANFAAPIEKYGDKDASERLRKIIMPFMLRRKKEDVLKDLPPKEEIVNFCEMDGEQKKLYDSLKAYYKNEISESINKNGVEKSAIKFFEGLLRLRQCVLFPGIIKEEYEKIESAKFNSFTGIIDDIVSEGHKVLIFSQFVEVLERLKGHADKNEYDYSYIDGRTKNRDIQIENFQNKENCSIFFLSLKAGGVGINLTRADYVILYDPWWNPAVENQAIDRSHRIGQKNKVIVYKLIVKDSIEEKILAIQETKKNLVKDIITEESSFYKSLKKEDIISLFE